MEIKINKLRDVLSNIVYHIPFLAMCGNLLGFIIFFRYYIKNQKKESVFICTIDLFLKHISETPLLFILLMWFMYNKYNGLNKTSLKCIAALWIINLPYILLDFKVDLYWFLSVITVYVIFVVLSIYRITNRI